MVLTVIQKGTVVVYMNIQKTQCAAAGWKLISYCRSSGISSPKPREFSSYIAERHTTLLYM